MTNGWVGGGVGLKGFWRAGPEGVVGQLNQFIPPPLPACENMRGAVKLPCRRE